MFERIMVPVDLAHHDSLAKALDCAATMAKQSRAEVIYVGVTAEQPSEIAHNPAEYEAKLKAFAEDQGARHGITSRAHAVASHDPATDLNATLLQAVEDTRADLVVMASHEPGMMDHFWPSHGGKLAEQAKCSVFVVR